MQLQIVYAYPDGREAAFDIHTSWVTPDNFPGYVEQEVQFRFDNGVWNAHQRKRGVELTVEGRTPDELKNTPNHHYNGTFLEPWGERSQRGYGIEIIERFFEEVAFVEFGGPPAERAERLRADAGARPTTTCRADRNTVADRAGDGSDPRAARGRASRVAWSKVNGPAGGLVAVRAGKREADGPLSGAGVIRHRSVHHERETHAVRVSKFLSKHLRHEPGAARPRRSSPAAGCRSTTCSPAAAASRLRHHPRGTRRGRRDQRQAALRLRRDRHAHPRQPGPLASRSICNSSLPTRLPCCTTAPAERNRRRRSSATACGRWPGITSTCPPTSPTATQGRRAARQAGRPRGRRRGRCAPTGTSFFCSANGVWLVERRAAASTFGLLEPGGPHMTTLPSTTRTNRPPTPTATRVAQLEPRALRTYTPTQAVLARSAGVYPLDPRRPAALRLHLRRARLQPRAQPDALDDAVHRVHGLARRRGSARPAAGGYFSAAADDRVQRRHAGRDRGEPAAGRASCRIGPAASGWSR